MIFLSVPIYCCERRGAKRSKAAEGGLAARKEHLLSQWVNQSIRRDPRPGPAQPSPARPWRSLKAYISERKQGTVLKFSGIMVVLDKIVVLNFETDIFKTPQMVAIFAKSAISAFFCCFLCITFEIHGILKFWKFHAKELKKCHKNDG